MRLVPYYQSVLSLRNKTVLGHEATIKGELAGKLIGAEAILRIMQRRDEVPSFDTQVHRIQIGSAPQDGKLFLNCELETLLKRRLGFVHDRDLSRYVLEITERNPNGMITDGISEYLLPYRKSGLKVAVDDFGTGQANFQWVADFAPDYLKIDRTVIRAIHHQERRQKFLQGLVRFAESIGTELIAEGVESQEQHEILVAEGVQFAQGYFYDVPHPIGQETPIYHESRA